jgi:glycosyltransferase involved in cell wall biosynthesis
MRILTYLTDLEAAGGVPVNVLQLTAALTERGHQVDVVYGADGNLGDAFRSMCSSVLPIPSPRYSGAQDIPRLLAGARIARRARPDLVYVQNFSELAWAVIVRTLTGARIVCHLHDFSESGTAYRKLIGGQVDRFVAVSRWLRSEWVDHGLDADRIDVVPNGVRPSDYPRGSDADRARGREQLSLPADAYVVLYAGRVIPDKGVDVLVDAWEQMGQPPEQARLLIVGGPPDDQNVYLRELRSRGTPGCEWYPMRSDVVRLMHAADVLVLPAVWNEPFGRVIIEAMSTGIPAVASAVGGIPEILDGEFEQMLFPRGDAAVLAERLRRLTDWRRRDPGLADRCADHVTARYALAETVTRLEAIFTHSGSRARRARRSRV